MITGKFPYLAIPLKIDSVNQYYYLLLPALFGTILLLLYLWVKPGFLGSDDLIYAQLAADVARGQFYLDPHHFTNRFGVYYPTAIIYLIFGVNHYTTTLWPLLSAIIALFTIFLLTDKLFGVETAVIASLLFIFNPLLISQIVYLLPDLPLGVFIFGAALALMLARLPDNQHKKLNCVFAFCLFVTLGILTKETGIWIVYFAGIILIIDFFLRQHLAIWMWCLIGGVVIAGSYLLFYYFATGDALFRLKGIEAGHNMSLWSYSAGKAGSLINRLTLGPFTLLVEERGLFLLLALSLPCLIYTNSRDGQSALAARFLALFGFSIIFSFWFGTTSVEAYNPLPLISRMLTPAIPALVIPAAYALYQLYIRERQSRSHYILWSITPVLALLTGSAYSYLVLANTPKFYLAASFCLLVPFLATYTPKPIYERLIQLGSIFLLAFVVYFTLVQINKGEFGETPQQKAEQTVIQHILTDLPQDAVLITSERSTYIIQYYNGLKNANTFDLVVWKEKPTSPFVVQRPFYLYFDEARERWLAEAYGDHSFTQFVDNNRAGWQTVKESKSVSLFYSN